MAFEYMRSSGGEPPISVPAIGLELHVRLPPAASGKVMTVIETVNAPGFGPPLHRHEEAEVFRVLEGRYLYQVDDQRFYASAGDLVSIPGGAVHAFVNVTDRPARQLIVISPGLDAVSFFTELGAVMKDGIPDTSRMDEFGLRWGVEFLGPPLKAA